MVPLDPDTAERLLSGRLDPDDAPPGYAEVARLLEAATGPADQAELRGEAAAMSEFRAARRDPATPSGVRGRASGVRGRLVALALAGAVVVGGVGVWTAGGGPSSRELGSPSGGPGAGGPGSGTPASSGYGPGVGGAGSLRPAGPGLGPSAGATQVTGGRPPSLPSARERATARHGGGVTSRGSGSRHGVKLNPPGKQPKPKPQKAKEPKDKRSKASESKAGSGNGDQ